MKKKKKKSIFNVGGKDIQNQQMNRYGFQDLEKTAEYIETHWYKDTTLMDSKRFGADIKEIYVDYLSYLLDDEKKQFLTANLAGFSYRDMIAALIWLDLPLNRSNEEQAVEFQPDKKRGMIISAKDK